MEASSFKESKIVLLVSTVKCNISLQEVVYKEGFHWSNTQAVHRLSDGATCVLIY